MEQNPTHQDQNEWGAEWGNQMITRTEKGMTGLEHFAQDSWAIEREILKGEGLKHIAKAHADFFRIPAPSIQDLQDFAFLAGPDCELRSKRGRRYNVQIGNHHPPRGGPGIPIRLEHQLNHIRKSAERSHRASLHETWDGRWVIQMNAMQNHARYERLHPFRDGNGRTGRLLWAWECVNAGLDPSLEWLPMRGFLQIAYYWALANSKALSQGQVPEAVHTVILEAEGEEPVDHGYPREDPANQPRHPVF